MNIHALHFSSKPSYKIIRSGAEQLDTAEFLAILLGRGTK
jgi:DNA repair protein RadC